MCCFCSSGTMCSGCCESRPSHSQYLSRRHFCVALFLSSHAATLYFLPTRGTLDRNIFSEDQKNVFSGQRPKHISGLACTDGHEVIAHRLIALGRVPFFKTYSAYY